jgi:hypothetical protein
MQIRFTLYGVQRTLTTEEVEESLAGKEPQRIFDYAVGVQGRWFPPKQAFVTPLGLTNRDVNSRTAFGHLRNLGFPTHDQRTQGPLPGTPGASSMTVPDSSQRELALRLACDLLAGTGASAADATGAANIFIAWLADR